PHASCERYPLSLHDALPICMSKRLGKGGRRCISPFSFVQTILDGIQYLGFLGGLEQIGIQSIVNRLFGEFKLCIGGVEQDDGVGDRKSTRLNSSHVSISYAV